MRKQGGEVHLHFRTRSYTHTDTTDLKHCTFWLLCRPADMSLCAQRPGDHMCPVTKKVPGRPQEIVEFQTAAAPPVVAGLAVALGLYM